jgi:CheY-like chemotaxis protein
LQFSVIDTGIGIPEDKVDTIFEDFIQADTSISRKFGGTGLGLTISRRLVELMNGSLVVKSTLGKGTVFTFDLYFEISNEVLEENSEPLFSERQLLGKRVLLVEDNEFNQLLALSILENWKVDIFCANNGVEAIEILKKQPFDVVLMDIQMPIMGGLEATQRIRNELRLSIPIIALTANAMKSELESYMQEGMNDYVTKPFVQQDLLKVLCRFFPS